MSRAFVKDDAPDAPPLVPPRAPLPDGVPNYVTPRGLALLREERQELERQRSAIVADVREADERQRQLSVVATRLNDLMARISTARVVRPTNLEEETIRFGAKIAVTDASGERREFQIVGVDEADVESALFAFTSPIARVLIGKRPGDRVTLETPQGEDVLTVESVSYASNDGR